MDKKILCRIIKNKVQRRNLDLMKTKRIAEMFHKENQITNLVKKEEY